MPALTLFGRSWMFGSDDFTFPGVSGVLLHGSWFIVLSIIFGLSYNDIPECNEGKLTKAYFCTLIPLLLVEIILEMLITIVSMRGTVMDTSKRTSIVKLIYVRLVLLIPEIFLTLAGSVWIFRPGPDCDEDIVWGIRVLIICQWIFLLVVLIFIIVLFNPLGKMNSDGQNMFGSTTAFQQAIESHFKKTCFCSGASGNQSDAFAEIAHALAIMFKDVDLVPSDIAAGLILLNKEHCRTAQDRLEESRQWLKHHAVTVEDLDTWAKFNESEYFFPFALGAYGWPLYCYMHLCCGLCQLCQVCKCGCTNRFRATVIEGDSCCYANTSGLISQLPSNYSNVELVFSGFKNDVYQTAFSVFIDHNKEKVVLSVRGTLSMKDVLTDLTAETDILELECDENCEEKCFGHRGIIKSARFIINKLEDENILDPIFTRYPNYQLMIVGHSLGAGTGTILSLLMKEKYESLHCFAYSPPQTLNLKAAKYCEDFVTSVVVGNDVISRLSINSVDILKKEIIDALHHCQLPKYQILLGGCWRFFSDCFSQCSNSDSETFHLLSGENSNIIYVANTNTHDATLESVQFDKLYCPGKILHLAESSKRSTFSLIHGDRNAFETIAIVPNMIANHVPDNVKKAYELTHHPNR